MGGGQCLKHYGISKFEHRQAANDISNIKSGLFSLLAKTTHDLVTLHMPIVLGWHGASALIYMHALALEWAWCCT